MSEPLTWWQVAYISLGVCVAHRIFVVGMLEPLYALLLRKLGWLRDE